jgi:simple sugar transport system permease protein
MDFLPGITLIVTQIVSYSTIYALSSLGLVLGGQAGIFNISGEGIMASAAAVAFVVALFTQSWVMGFFAGCLVGIFFGLLFIFLHVRFNVDQFIIGITLIIAGIALGDLVFKITTDTFISIPKTPLVPVIRIPFLSSIPIIGGFFNQNIITYLAYVLIALIWWFLYKTKNGLEFRAVGENPKAADVVGIPVIRIRILATMLGAALMGLAGSYLPLVAIGSYSIGMISGRGLMSIGIAIFANWKPQRILPSALIFAAFEVLALNWQMALGRKYIFLMQTLPFIAVLIIMMFAKQIKFPGALGEPYNRE